VETEKRASLKSSLARGQTTSPALAPPRLLCPDCETPLGYRHSFIGGVNARNAEQWDYYGCNCGVFQYRHRSRKLRKISSSSPVHR
jgi:hypothetical protein